MGVESAPKVHERYVQRVRGRLAKASISVEDARDGVLDCFVSTYHEGLGAGLRGVVGVEAGPDEVARVAAGLFRKRLRAHGASFEAPTVDALAKVKAEVDEELHFAELPVELRSTHDRVCELLISKAEGTVPHDGDRSAVRPASPVVTGPTPEPSATAPATSASPRPAEPEAAPRASATRGSGARAMRDAIGALLEELSHAAREGAPLPELLRRMEKARRLVETVHELETP